MFDYREEWLPHLKDSISPEAGIPGVSLYTIALEGWRRGLNLKFYSDENRIKYALSDEKVIHHFDDSSGNLNTEEAISICGDKGITNKYLEKVNVPVPRGKEFTMQSSIKEMLSYAGTLNYPLVVKPVDGLGGAGVKVNLRNEKEVMKSIKYLREKLSFNKIIIQEHIKGKEVRIYVLDGKIVGAVHRIPANITGDGKKTILNLILEKNEYRKAFPQMKYRPIRIDSELLEVIEQSGYNLYSVLEKGELLYLREISNVSIGGEPIDYTDKLTNEQKEIAIKATKSIPGLIQCGVDMMIRERDKTGIVIELNSSPGIGSHLFPVSGEARDIPKAIIDYYFPETKEMNIENPKLYYNLGKVIDGLSIGTISSIEIPNYPSETIYAKEIIISLESDLNSLFSQIKYYANKNKMNGFLEYIDDSLYRIVICYTKEKSFRQFFQMIQKNNEIRIKEKQEWRKPIQLGFEFKGKNKSTAYLENKHKYSFREFGMLDREVKRLDKRIKQMKKSNSWRITKPIRLLAGVFNNKS